MGSRDLTDKGPYGSRIRGLHRAPVWLSDVLPAEARQTWPIVLPVAAAGAAVATAAVVALVRDPPGASTLAGLAGLLLASLLAEAFPLPLEGVTVSTTSLAIVFIVATAVIYGWAEAAVVGFLTVALVEAKRKRPLTRTVFNTGLYVCSGAAAGLAAARLSDGDVGSLVLAGFVGAAAFYAVNMVLLAAVIARVRSTPYLATLRRQVTTTALPFLVIASLTVTVVVLWDRSPLLALLVVGPLLTIALYERWLHRSLERLREFDQLKDEFIAVISHELRTPLTSVYGAAVTLQRREVRGELRRSLLAIVSNESARLARLLDDALSASRLDAKTERFDIRPTDGSEVARDVAEATRTHLSPGLGLELVLEPDLPPIAADVDKLRQVLVNLTENAIKYSPDGGRIELAVGRNDGVVRFSVRDEGLGIPPEEQAHVFERFHRVDPHMTRGVSGSGLGLYICKELVEGMDGRIWVRSREGAGSTFSFELPVASARA